MRRVPPVSSETGKLQLPGRQRVLRELNLRLFEVLAGGGYAAKRTLAALDRLRVRTALFQLVRFVPVVPRCSEMRVFVMQN